MICSSECYTLNKAYIALEEERWDRRDFSKQQLRTAKGIMTSMKNDTYRPKTGGLKKGKYGLGQTTEAVEQEKALDDFIAAIKRGEFGP